MRIDSRAEWLYWYQADVNYYDGGWLAYKKLKLKIITFDYSGAAQNTVYLDDFEDNLLESSSNPKSHMCDTS